MVELLLQIAPVITKVVLLTNPDTVGSNMRPFIAETANPLGVAFMDAHLPLNFHPAATKASAVGAPGWRVQLVGIGQRRPVAKQ